METISKQIGTLAELVKQNGMGDKINIKIKIKSSA